jgi:HAD superfamily hydrolase (TIGR01490 family)
LYPSSSFVPSDVLALFDLDHTLLALDSDQAWVEFLIGEGALDRAVFEQGNRAIVDRYRRGEVGVLEFTEFYLATLKGRDPAQLNAWRDNYLARAIRPAIPAAARALVEPHRRTGDLLVLTTATSRFLTAPIAEELGFEHLIATEPETIAGHYTGKVSGTPNMREGKIVRLEAWLAQRGQRLDDFRESWFYSDSRNDVPLLERITHPIAVNPDPTLAALARARAWPMIEIR